MIDYKKCENWTEKDLEKNYNDFITFVKKVLPDSERTIKLLRLYDKFADRIATAPASGKANFHMAIPGGYVCHIMNVCRSVTGVKKLYEAIGGTIDFLDTEMYFACLNHDLGKIGDENGDYYIPEDSQWKRDQGTLYKINGQIQNMHVTDRSLFQLQKHGIETTQKEWLAIKLSDGLYEEENKYYLISNTHEKTLKTNLPHIVHTADFLSFKMEKDAWNKTLPDIT